MVQQLLHAHPLEKHRRVVRKEHLAQFGIDPLLGVFASLANGQQGKIVVAERDDALLTQRMNQS